MRAYLTFFINFIFAYNNFTCQDRGLKRPGSNYVGKEEQTMSGKQCIKWSEVAKTKHGNTWKHGINSGKYKESKNFCRNFHLTTKLKATDDQEDNFSTGVWCYYKENQNDISYIDWDYCDVQGNFFFPT